MRRALLFALTVLLASSCGGKNEGGKTVQTPAAEKKEQVAAPAAAPAEATPAVAVAATAAGKQEAGKEQADKARADSIEKAGAPSEIDQGKVEALAKEEDGDVVSTETGKMPLAKLGDNEVMLEDLQAWLNTMPAYERREYTAFSKKKELLKKYLLVKAIMEEATKEGVDKDPQVQAAVQNAVMKVFLSRRFDENKLPPVGEDEIAARYAADKDRYVKPEKVRAAHIMLNDRKKAEELLETLKRRFDRPGIRVPSEFAEAARKNSMDEETARRGGDLLFFSIDGKVGPGKSIDPELARAAFEIKEINGLSKVVRGEKGYHIILLLNRRPAESRSLDQAREELKIIISREKLELERQKYLDGLVNLDAWEVDMKELNGLQMGDPEGSPDAERARMNAAREMPGDGE